MTGMRTSCICDEELALCAQAGDRRAADILVGEYFGFVCNRVKSYYLAGGDREDAVQEGLIGLYKAIRDYSPVKNASFRSFASLCISRQMISAVRTCTRRKHAPLNSYISLDPENEDGADAGLLSCFNGCRSDDPEAMLINRESLDGIECKIKSALSSFELNVLMHYLGGMTYRQIGEQVKRDAKSVDNAVQRIRRKLGDVLGRS